MQGLKLPMMAQMSSDGFSLANATEEARGNRERVMKAVSEDGTALQHAANELKGNREIVMQAVFPRWACSAVCH